MNTLRDLFAGTKESMTDPIGDCLTADISKLAPLYFSSKTFNEYPKEESIRRFEKILDDMMTISQIFEHTDYFRIVKSIELFSSSNPSLVSRLILDFNLFPSNEKRLFDKIDLSEYFKVRIHNLVNAC